ncbi:hypothetical protein Plhal703r1_c19g0086491 [Plasmopara halstedii]
MFRLCLFCMHSYCLLAQKCQISFVVNVWLLHLKLTQLSDSMWGYLARMLLKPWLWLGLDS